MALMYSFSNLEPVWCSMSDSNCSFLTCIQISQETGQVIWYSHLFKKEYSGRMMSGCLQRLETHVKLIKPRYKHKISIFTKDKKCSFLGIGTNHITLMVSNGNLKYYGTMSFHLDRCSRYNSDLNLFYII